MTADLRRAIERMTREERLDFLDEMWSIVCDDGLPLPASHAEEIQRRLAAADADGVLGEPLDAVTKRLRGAT